MGTGRSGPEKSGWVRFPITVGMENTDITIRFVSSCPTPAMVYYPYNKEAII